MSERTIKVVVFLVLLAGAGFGVVKYFGASEGAYKEQVSGLLGKAEEKLAQCRSSKSDVECRGQINAVNALLAKAGQPLLEVPPMPGASAEPAQEIPSSENSADEKPDDDAANDGSSDDAVAEVAPTQVPVPTPKPTQGIRRPPPESVSFKLDGERYEGDVKLVFNPGGTIKSMEFAVRARKRAAGAELSMSAEEFAAGKVNIRPASTTAQLVPINRSEAGSASINLLAGTGRSFFEVNSDNKRIVSSVSAVVEVDQYAAEIKGDIAIDSNQAPAGAESDETVAAGSEKPTVLSIDEAGKITYFQKFKFFTPYTPEADVK